MVYVEPKSWEKYQNKLHWNSVFLAISIIIVIFYKTCTILKLPYIISSSILLLYIFRLIIIILRLSLSLSLHSKSRKYNMFQNIKQLI